MMAHRVTITYDGVMHSTVLPTKESAVLFARRWFLGTFMTEDDGAKLIEHVMFGRGPNGAIVYNSVARSIAISAHTAWMDFPEFVDREEVVFETSNRAGAATISIEPVGGA